MESAPQSDDVAGFASILSQSRRFKTAFVAERCDTRKTYCVRHEYCSTYIIKARKKSIVKKFQPVKTNSFSNDLFHVVGFWTNGLQEQFFLDSLC